MGNYFRKHDGNSSTTSRSGGVKRKFDETVMNNEDDLEANEESISQILNYSQTSSVSLSTPSTSCISSNNSSSSSSSSSSGGDSVVRTFYPNISKGSRENSTSCGGRSDSTTTTTPTTSSNNTFNINKSSILSQIKPDLIRPCRKKMKSTSNYIYNTLFVNGESSDICVRALNREWHLHKLYLCQSPYFDSMFKGSKWRESSESQIEIAIPDENITEKSLEIALGSFYREEISLIPIEVISVLACASLFSLEGLITQCESLMLENINAQTVLAYYDASLVYGVNRVAEKCLEWLAMNLMINDEIRLENIGFVLFDKVLGFSKCLLIIQVETDLYSLCKKWLYYQLIVAAATANNENCSDGTGTPFTRLDSKTWQKTTNEFYKGLIARQSSETGCLLDDEAFSKYVPIFRKIRLQNIINDLQSLKLICNDRIIPTSWIEPLYSKNWQNLLFIDQDRLSNEFDIDLNDFENGCLRFGRILNNDSPATWRWVGFNYGIDLLMAHSNRTLSLKRNTLTQHSPYKGLLSNKQHHRVYYIIKLVELDKNGNKVWSKKTDLACLDFNKNEDKTCLTIDPKVKYPLLLNLLVAYYPAKLNYQKINETATS